MWLMTYFQTLNPTQNSTEVSRTQNDFHLSDMTSNHVKQVSTKTRKGFEDLGLESKDFLHIFKFYTYLDIVGKSTRIHSITAESKTMLG